MGSSFYMNKKKYVVRYKYNMTENNRILLGKIGCQDRFYQIEKKGRYKVFIPENDSEIICPNMNCVKRLKLHFCHSDCVPLVIAVLLRVLV